MRDGKQIYTILYLGKSIKTSVDKKKLEKICDEINTNGFEYFKKQEENKKKIATIVKHGFSDSGKQLWGIKYQKKIINVSVDKKKIEMICDEINSNIN